MQRVPNPVPRVKHPDWLHRKVRRNACSACSAPAALDPTLGLGAEQAGAHSYPAAP